jgi:hypothetical protein
MTEAPPVPVLSATRFDESHAPTCLSNGLIGITPGPNPLLQGGVLVSGFVYSHPPYGFENIAPAPYPLGLDLGFGGRRMRDAPDSVVVQGQALDMATGELVTRMTFQPSPDARFSIEVVQFVSRTVPCLACQEVRIGSDDEREIELMTSIDFGGIPGRVFTGDTDPYTRGWYEEDLVDRCLGFSTDRSRLGVATIVARRPGIVKRGPGRYVVAVSRDRPAVFRTIAALVSEPYGPDPHLEAVRLARWGEMLGFETLREDNRQAWTALWKSRIRIVGSADDQRGIDAAFYYYHSSIHPSVRAGIPPFALVHHDRYFGHVFWDMDLWMLIPAILAAPDCARSILEYRVRGLEAARRKAALFGYRGVQFPWEASLDGWEVTPSCCPTGWAEQHVTPGVAIGAWECQLSCGDEESLRDAAWPILKAVAVWIESRGQFTDRGFEIGHVMGPDEGITDLSNQTYFNLLSKMALSAAIDCCRTLGLRPPVSWKRIRDSMVVPRDRATGAVLPFDLEGTVRVHDPVTRAFEERDAASSLGSTSLGNLQYLFLHGCPVDERTFRATWLREEEIRMAALPDGPVPGGSRLPGFTTGPFAVCAAHFGERRKAAELFTAAWKPFWMEPFGMTRECQDHTWGGFVTNNGSLLQSVLLGFTGLRIGKGLEARYAASLPEGWQRIEVERVWSSGRATRLTAVQGRRTALAPSEE